MKMNSMKNRFEIEDCIKWFKERGYTCQSTKEDDGSYSVLITMTAGDPFSLPLTTEQISKRAKQYRDSKPIS